jgi:VanZ family protein
MLLAGDTPYAVDLTDPIGFTAYMGMAFVLYAIRETRLVPNRYIPILAVVLGLLYSIFIEFNEVSERSFVAGIRLALLGVGSVAAIKYFLEKDKNVE